MILANVVYKVKPGMREAFLEALEEAGTPAGSRAEAGNLRYDYYYPVGNETDLFLLEYWRDQAAYDFHTQQPYFSRLKELKEQYVEETIIDMLETK